jgi:hypothetical protein
MFLPAQAAGMVLLAAFPDQSNKEVYQDVRPSNSSSIHYSRGSYHWIDPGIRADIDWQHQRVS